MVLLEGNIQLSSAKCAPILRIIYYKALKSKLLAILKINTAKTAPVHILHLI
jgi:hypothetical protein